jgi:type I restriction enzyme S subunit
MGEIPLTLPKSVEEQHRISGLFEQIDNLITLHQRKIDEMKEFKKGLLQQMFV